MTKDWIGWHRAYDDPQSPLSQRLAVVSGILRAAFDAAPAGEIRVVSLCAGEARDLALAAAGHPRSADLAGCVVEFDATLCAAATGNLSASCPGVQVRCADAGDTSVYADVLPADVVVLAGIFGNLTDADVEHTIGQIPAMCRPGATIVWTRHRREPDLTPMIRSWFSAAGCGHRHFESPGRERFGVGSEIYRGETAELPVAARLFTFREDLW